MLGIDIAPGTLVCVLAYSVAVTLVTNWLVGGTKRPGFSTRMTVRVMLDTLAYLIWISLMVVYGLLAVRYVERMSSAIAGYLLFAVLGFLFSLIRAQLYRRAQQLRQSERAVDCQALASMLLHNSSYLLFALVLYLALSWLLRLSVDPILLIPLWIGALLPDLDERDSLPGRVLPCLSQSIESRLGHLEEWHTLAATALVALISSPLILFFGAQPWYLVLVGFVSHLFLDLLAPRGVMLFWPLRRVRYTVFRGAVQSEASSRAERITPVVLMLTAVVLFFAVGLSSTSQPAAAPMLSYEQTLARYYSWRGRLQVFAQIAGSWQISGRPISGRFEILNARDDSYVLLDRFGDKVFTAGRTSADNVYLDRIVLQSGSAVTVKPVEVHLEQQPLSDAFGTVYEMQSEPGLQHIYASGSLLLSDQVGVGSPMLRADHSLTSLRKIQVQEGELYNLRYLTAAELTQLAGLHVEVADLVIVATYTPAVSGPTATPLPSPSSAGGPVQ